MAGAAATAEVVVAASMQVAVAAVSARPVVVAESGRSVAADFPVWEMLAFHAVDLHEADR